MNESNLKPLMSVAETIKSNLRGIINSMDKGVSNARAEAINRKIKDAGRRASGYRNLERYKTAIIFLSWPIGYGSLITTKLDEKPLLYSSDHK